MTTITVTNPWSGSTFEKDVTDLTQKELDAYATVMDDESREAANDKFEDGMTPGQWLAIWAEMVGSEEAGRVVLGS